jgi:hypothetical protein
MIKKFGYLDIYCLFAMKGFYKLFYFNSDKRVKHFLCHYTVHWPFVPEITEKETLYIQDTVTSYLSSKTISTIRFRCPMIS